MQSTLHQLGVWVDVFGLDSVQIQILGDQASQRIDNYLHSSPKSRICPIVSPITLSSLPAHAGSAFRSSEAAVHRRCEPSQELHMAASRRSNAFAPQSHPVRPL